MNASARFKGICRGALAGTLSFATTLVATQLPAVAATEIPSATTIDGSLTTDLDSGKAQVGDGFTIAVARPYPNDDVSYAGSYIRGHVARAIRAGQGRKAEIDLAFDNIVLSNGASAPLDGHVVRVDPKQKTAILQQAAGAGVGMVVGNILGKWAGTNFGGVVGAAGGFTYANNRKTDFTLRKGSVVTLETDHTVPRPQARY